MTEIRSYSELLNLETFEERFEYLKLGGSVGQATFGFDRWVNQEFYTSHEWKTIRNRVIVRDNGCDLGVMDYEIHVGLLVHHMNPMTPEDILHGEAWTLDPNFLITTSHRTHNAIHYGAPNPYPKVVLNRSPGDTKPW
jgi:hypothetical protein